MTTTFLEIVFPHAVSLTSVLILVLVFFAVFVAVTFLLDCFLDAILSYQESEYKIKP